MSRQIKAFSDYFMQGMALGGKWAEQWEARQIAKARNDIMKERNAAVDKRENAKLGLYGEQVRANAELAKARAYRALNPVAKGGGGKSDPTANPGLDSLTSRWAARDAEAGRSGALPQARAPQSGGTTNNYYSGEDGGGGDGSAPSPPSEGGYGDSGSDYVSEQAEGGMVKGYAEGGIVEGMSLNEARSYDTGMGGSSPKKAAKPAANPFGSAASSAASKYKAPEEKKKPEPDVRPTGPVGSGAGGSYTTDDVPTLTAGAGFRAGGAVRNDSGSWYALGGAVQEASPSLTDDYDPEAVAQEMRRYMAQTQWQPNPPEQPSGIQDMGGSANAATGNTSGTVGGSTAAGGGGSEAAVGGTGGIGGSASSDAGAGGSAAAGTGGADGGTYRRGGQVRRYQSGGRVMREPTAIDTGTTGPMSGYGYRAPPPGNAQRRY